MSNLCTGIPANLLLEALLKEQITHVVTVPDTHQKTLLNLISLDTELSLIQVCTEDEAIAVAAGLYIANKRPMLLIQNAGFYACLNSVRGLALDARIPICMLIGEYLRNPELSSKEDPSRVVHLLEPTLESWNIPFWRLDSTDDIGNFAKAFRHSWENSIPTAALIGAPTV